MTAYCPTHGTELDGGPIRYQYRSGHTVKADEATNEPRRSPWL